MLGFSLFILVFFTLRPITKPMEGDCTAFKGTLKSYYYNENSKDVHLSLKGHHHRFYINHLQPGLLDIKVFYSLLGEEVVIYGVNHWTLLNPKQKMRHVARISSDHGTKVIYTEY